MKILIKIFIIILFSCSINAKSAIDMVGRKVTIPSKTERVFAASPPMTVLLYALAPEKMIGVNYKFLKLEKKYMLKRVANLPVLGSFYSSGGQVNLEKVLSKKPDMIFMWDIVRKNSKSFKEVFDRLNIPVVYIRENTIEDNIEALRTMGVFLGKENRAKILIKYAQKILDKVKKSVDSLGNIKRKKVYFAEGVDGLTSECDGTIQAQIIPLAGGINVNKCDSSLAKDGEKSKISLEKLYTYNPDVIFVSNKVFFDSLKNKKSPWRKLKAFKNKNIYFCPISPFNWLSRPPSLMRFIGLEWMHNKLYPKHFKINIIKEVQKFYKLFLHVKLSKQDVKNLLKGE